MQFAVNENGERILAEVASKECNYYCPICGGKVILKKGRINVAHFDHAENNCNDDWNYDMSEWHFSMQ